MGKKKIIMGFISNVEILKSIRIVCMNWIDNIREFDGNNYLWIYYG